MSAALELAPTNRDYLMFMGVLLHETGNWEEAVDYLKKALGAVAESDVGTDTEEQTFENEEFEVRPESACCVTVYLS